MGYPADFVNPILACQSPTMIWPSLSAPGLPNFVLGCFAANFAGISYVLNFIPPSPSNPPSLPGINLFLAPFMAALTLPASYPGISLNLGGVPITIPGVGSPPYAYPFGGELNFIAMNAVLPFLIIKAFIDGLLNLQIVLPTVSGVESIFFSLAAELGMSGIAIATFGGCLATGIVDLFTNLIP